MGTTTNNAWPYPASTDAAGLGATNITNLATAIDTSLGKVAWIDYDTFTLGGGIAWGTPTKNGRYCRMGNIVWFDYTITLGAGSPALGASAGTVSLPVAANTNTSEYLSAWVWTDTSAGIVYSMNYSIESTTAVLYIQSVSGTNIRVQSWTSTTSPAAIASGDILRITGWYEAA